MVVITLKTVKLSNTLLTNMKLFRTIEIQTKLNCKKVIRKKF